MAEHDNLAGGGDGSDTIIDPGAISADATIDSTGAIWDPNKHATGPGGGPVYRADGSFRSRRGSGGGGRTNTGSSAPRARAPAAGAIPVESYAGMLAQVHAVLAGAMNAPEMVLGDDEAKALASAMANVQAQYQTKINPRQQAWAQLAIVAGAIYIPKAIQIKQRIDAERTENGGRRQVS